MAKTRLQIQQALAKQRALENLPKSFIASMGDRNGTVSAGGNNIYVRDIVSGFTFVAKNVSVPNAAGRLVNVEQRGRELYVIGYWNIYGAEDSSDSFVGSHGSAHSYGSGDTIFIGKDQLKPFLVLPYSGFTVQVFGGVFVTSTGEVSTLANQQVDLSGNQPASGAIYVLLEFDDDGVITVTEGTSALSKDALTLAHIPTITAHPLIAIRLYATQTEIARDPTEFYDFVDPRFGIPDPNPPHNNLSDVEGGGDYLGVLEAYHLSLAEWEALVKGISADGYHFHNASAIVYSPYGCVEATNVQDALEELEDKIDTKISYYRQYAWEHDGGTGWTFVSEDDGTGNDIPVFILEATE